MGYGALTTTTFFRSCLDQHSCIRIATCLRGASGTTKLWTTFSMTTVCFISHSVPRVCVFYQQRQDGRRTWLAFADAQRYFWSEIMEKSERRNAENVRCRGSTQAAHYAALFIWRLASL